MPKQPLKIGFVLDDTLDTPDGVQQYVLTIGEWLRGQGHEVHYLVGETYRTDIVNVHSMAKNVKVSFNKNKLSIPLPAKKAYIKHKLEELQLDVIHVQMPYSPLFAGRVINTAPPQTKIIGTFHIVPATWLEKAGAKSLQLITRSTLKKFTHIISVSSAAQTFAQTVFGIESVILPNCVPLAAFSHAPIYKKPLHIVFLGRLVERKGCAYLLRALTLLAAYPDVPDYQVTIAGKGPLRERLQTYVTRAKLPNVQFIGFVSEEDKPQLLASADIAVFPSTGGESFGIVLIEAMAAGSRVVLGGDNIGYRSVLSKNDALLVDPRDSEEFAHRLHLFLTDDALRKKTYAWLQHEKLQYDVAVVGQKLLTLYQAEK